MLTTTSSTEGYLQVSAVQRRSRAIMMREARSRSSLTWSLVSYT